MARSVPNWACPSEGQGYQMVMSHLCPPLCPRHCPCYACCLPLAYPILEELSRHATGTADRHSGACVPALPLAPTQQPNLRHKVCDNTAQVQERYAGAMPGYDCVLNRLKGQNRCSSFPSLCFSRPPHNPQVSDPITEGM